MLILIRNPNDYTVYIHAICTCENGHRNKRIREKQSPCSFGLNHLGQKVWFCWTWGWVSIGVGEAFFRAFVRIEPLLAGPVSSSSVWRDRDELFNLRKAFPSWPCCELTTVLNSLPCCQFGQGPSWRSMPPLDLGIKRDFLVHIGLVGFRKAFYDCVILATAVSWFGDWGQVWQ